jgi:hypothetical protein
MNKLTNRSSNIKNQVTNRVANLTEKGKELGQKVTNTIKEKIQNVSNTVKTANVPGGSVQEQASKFAESNSAISKFIFIIFLLIVFLFLFNVGVMVLQKLMGNTKDPMLLNGLVSSKKTTKISVNPNEKDSVPLYRSVNEDQGAEFTWNVWFFIEDLNSNNPTYSRIFSKGSENSNLSIRTVSACSDTSCRNVFNSSPGLFVTKNKQTTSVFPNSTIPQNSPNHVNLILMLNTYKPLGSSTEFAESITIENIPMKKWVCCTIRVQQTTVDIYINGIMTQRKKLNNLPRQNYYDVKVGDSNDGFDGAISSLRYFSRALSYDDIQSVYGKGPNLTSLENHGLNAKDYLSINWYYK